MKEEKMFKKYKNIGIFRLSPENEYSNYTISHFKKGDDYHNRFDSFPGRRHLFSLEKEVVFREASGFIDHLDFACGTGRWLSLPNTQNSYGVDVSESMLKTARRNSPDSKIFKFNFKELDELKGLSFDLITAFRFFPNADLELRRDAMRYIADKLNHNGTLILNNHRNFWSLPYIFFRFLFLGFWQAGMSHKQVVDLLEGSGLRVVKSYSLGIIPQGERKAILPWFIVNYIERINARYFSKFHRLGYDVIYICKK
jgi:SAM-dependent methyltransferase